ncbi:MAG: YfcE family phosphodiesterase [Bacillota bacterium]|nr:YfcE family phosphodiesterase [Bacillota bacterium]
MKWLIFSGNCNIIKDSRCKESVPVIIVRGNCDAEVDQLLIKWPLQAPYTFLQIEGLRFLVTHGHQVLPEELQAQAQRYRVKLLISGHAHLSEIRKEKGVIFLNPGSPALPKDAFPRPTVALVDGGSVRLMDVETGQNLKEVLI